MQGIIPDALQRWEDSVPVPVPVFVPPRLIFIVIARGVNAEPSSAGPRQSNAAAIQTVNP